MGPLHAYFQAIEGQRIEEDPHQLQALEKYQRLFEQLQAYDKEGSQWSWKHRWGLEEPPRRPKGIYVHGGVGSGKVGNSS